MSVDLPAVASTAAVVASMAGVVVASMAGVVVAPMAEAVIGKAKGSLD
jgi:hypothetical protein